MTSKCCSGHGHSAHCETPCRRDIDCCHLQHQMRDLPHPQKQSHAPRRANDINASFAGALFRVREPADRPTKVRLLINIVPTAMSPSGGATALGRSGGAITDWATRPGRRRSKRPLDDCSGPVNPAKLTTNDSPVEAMVGVGTRSPIRAFTIN